MGTNKASKVSTGLPAGALGTSTSMITASAVAKMLGISRGAVYDLVLPKAPRPVCGLGGAVYAYIGLKAKRTSSPAHICTRRL